MKLLELRNQYYKKKITKSKFIKEIYNKYHHLLFEYSDLIKQTDIKKN